MRRVPGEVAACTCGAQLIFLTSSKTGKLIPVEARASTVYVKDPDGFHCAPVEANVTVAGQVQPATIHVNHFQTCPDRERFRRKG